MISWESVEDKSLQDLFEELPKEHQTSSVLALLRMALQTAGLVVDGIPVTAVFIKHPDIEMVLQRSFGTWLFGHTTMVGVHWKRSRSLLKGTDFGISYNTGTCYVGFPVHIKED